MHGRKINGNALAIVPRHGLFAGLMQDPFADLADQPDLLGNRDELVRRNNSPFRVIPADESFVGSYIICVERDLRLIVDLKF